MTKQTQWTFYAPAVAAALLAAPLAAAADSGDLQSVDIPALMPGQNFGKFVAGVGDVNGDGFDDVAVAGPYTNDGAGAVYVYFGGSEFFDTEPDLVLHGQAASDQFGISIAGGMDLNGNGFGDIAVGARFSDLGASNAGAVFIYFGGPTLSDQPDLILTGEVADDWFGQSVSSAGDVNGDGYDDLIVGAPFNDDVGNAAGKAYIFFGGPRMNAQPDVILYGASVNHAHFGWSVSGAGDVNGDGFDDVIVGARLHGTGPNQGRGRVYIFHGGDPMNETPDLIIEGEAPHNWFGQAVSGAGDVNGDGYDDVIVGAHFASPAGASSGKAYVFLGGPDMNDIADFTFAGPHADAQLGAALSGAGDVNGNGHDDIIIGAHFANGDGGAAAGSAYVVFGGPGMSSNTFDVEVSGSHANEQFGESVDGAGLVTGQPPAAFIVGAHHNNEIGTGSGMAHIYHFADEKKDDPPDDPIPGDLTGDGTVGVDDLLILLAEWGLCADCADCHADLTGDCTVGVDDLLILLANWG